MSNLRIIEDLKSFLNQSVNESSMRQLFTDTPTCFIRDRKLPFDRLALLLINLLKKSYSIEIEDFYQLLDEPEMTCSKSAFCQQRMKLKNIFFSCWNSVLVDSYYRHYEASVKRWKGFRLMAVDGSTAYLVNKTEIVDYFGTQSNQAASVPMGRVMTCYDVLNRITVFNEMYPISYAEQYIANCWLAHYDKDMLMLYDRGYPSFASIYLHLHQEQEQKFVMRCSNNFNKEVTAFTDSNLYDKTVMFKASEKGIKELYKHGFIITPHTTVTVRLIKVKLKGGQTEILITNLFDSETYPVKIFKALYFKRWGIETNYETHKNKLQLESFTGHKVNTIMQDFYATFFVGNLQEILSKPCKSRIKETTIGNKYEYKINRNIAIGLMKNKIVKLFTEEYPQTIISQLENLFVKYLEPVRPDREYPRVVKRKRAKGKYQTFTNYRRAA
ncbi:IS4 family transposase [Mucilaginibacter sp. UC70_90]